MSGGNRSRWKDGETIKKVALTDRQAPGSDSDPNELNLIKKEISNMEERLAELSRKLDRMKKK